MFTPNLNYKRWLILSLATLVFGIIFGFFAFPKILEEEIKKEINVAPGTRLRGFYQKPPVYLDFKIYLFNVTNKDEVNQGKKPKLQEVGPYFFEEWKEKYDFVDDEEEDTLTYHYNTTYKFRPDLSGGLTGDETIVMPHPMIMGAFLAASIDKEAMLPVIEDALDQIFHEPKDAFYSGRAMDILFDGVELDCNAADPMGKMVCSHLKGEKQFRPLDNGNIAFSIFQGTNHTNIAEMKVFRGKKNYQDLGRVISVNNKTESEVWTADECNEFIGTDSTIAPALLTEENALWAYDHNICRSMAASFKTKSEYNGIPIHIYELDISDELNAKPCFCRSKDSCPPKGAFDLFRCTGLPMIATLPHFYMAEELLNNVESGLKPEKEKHAIIVYLEHLSGTAFKAHKRMQFNLEVRPLPQIEIMTTLPTLIFPMFWVEEGIVLDKEWTDKLQNTIFLAINIANILTWLCIIVGAFGSVGCVAMMVMSGGKGSMSVADKK